jgi:hypothetical protein
MRNILLVLRSALLAAAGLLCLLKAAQAGTYLVCYLPLDAQNRLVRFCPGASDATAGQPCECLLRTETLAGTMTRITISESGTAAASSQTMCVPQAQPGTPVTLCPAFRSDGQTNCACGSEAGGENGERYTVTLMPRIPLRTNQTAAADFLTRLKECCVPK